MKGPCVYLVFEVPFHCALRVICVLLKEGIEMLGIRLGRYHSTWPSDQAFDEPAKVWPVIDEPHHGYRVLERPTGMSTCCLD